MKICLTVNSSPWSRFKGGGQLAVHRLACALSAKGQEVHAVYSKHPDEHPQPDAPYAIHWARHHDLATVNFNIFSFLRVLRPLAAKEKFDIIHGNAEEAYYASAVARTTGAAYVFTSHAPNIPPTGMLAGLLHPLRFMKSINTYLLRGAACGARQIVTFSRFSRDLVVEALGSDYGGRVEVISPGVDPSWFEVARNPAAEPRLLFWGRVEAEKGLTGLFDALGEISADVPDIKVTVVGEGNRLEDYKRQVSHRGLTDRVEFPGWLDTAAIQHLAGRCRLGVFPSRIESFGLSVIEAMACGLPVVAARAGAIPENVEHGVAGTLVPPEDARALAASVRDVLEHPERYESMAQKARDTARQKFSWDRAADQMIALYRQVLEQ